MLLGPLLTNFFYHHAFLLKKISTCDLSRAADFDSDLPSKMGKHRSEHETDDRSDDTRREVSDERG